MWGDIQHKLRLTEPCSECGATPWEQTGFVADGPAVVTFTCTVCGALSRDPWKGVNSQTFPDAASARADFDARVELMLEEPA